MPNQFLSPEGDLENYFVTESFLIDQWVGDTLWNWGRNASGQLGTNDTNNKCTPVTTFAGGTNWKQVSSGGYHTAAIKTDGTLWTWGSNLFAQLGTNDAGFPGETQNRPTPVTTFVGGTNWKQVSCGLYHTAAIKTDGTLWSWGYSEWGQLGINSRPTMRCTPVTTFAGGTNWKQVDCGRYHTAAIKTDGTLWVWGDNTNGELGNNNVSANSTTSICTPITTFAGGTNWKQVSGGTDITVAIKTDGTLWFWGYNGNGNLGTNDTNTRCTPVTTFAGGTNWKQVSCEFYRTAAIKTDGTLWTWGDNTNGGLGTNDTNTRCTPVTTFAGGTNWKQVDGGTNHTAAIKTDGTLWTWGYNAFGGLGINDTNTRCTPITTFAGGTNWKQVFCGNWNTVAVTSGTDPTYFIS